MSSIERLSSSKGCWRIMASK
ncbi:MAG: hypothetical protein LBD48_02310 [Treponema sp.]|nr:hypothetical protein [Treponema sp.]